MLISSNDKEDNFSASVRVLLFIFISRRAGYIIPGSRLILEIHLSIVEGAGNGIFQTFPMFQNALGLMHFEVIALAMSSSFHLFILFLNNMRYTWVSEKY